MYHPMLIFERAGRGDDPEEVIRRIADSRSSEKSDALCYAQLTVKKAQDPSLYRRRGTHNESRCKNSVRFLIFLCADNVRPPAKSVRPRQTENEL